MFKKKPDEPGEKAPQLLTPQDVAERLKIDRESVYALVKRRELDAMKLGPRTLRVTEASLAAFIESHRKRR